MKNNGINQPFKQKFAEFIKEKNSFRNQNPQLFKVNTKSNNEEIQEKLEQLLSKKLNPDRKYMNKSSLSPVKQIRSKSAFDSFKENASTGPSDYGQITPSDVRTIKQKNYGKWYLKPKQFNQKLAPIANVK